MKAKLLSPRFTSALENEHKHLPICKLLISLDIIVLKLRHDHHHHNHVDHDADHFDKLLCHLWNILGDCSTDTQVQPTLSEAFPLVDDDAHDEEGGGDYDDDAGERETIFFLFFSSIAEKITTLAVE